MTCLTQQSHHENDVRCLKYLLARREVTELAP
jgi:hypothetical protein